MKTLTLVFGLILLFSGFSFAAIFAVNGSGVGSNLAGCIAAAEQNHTSLDSAIINASAGDTIYVCANGTISAGVLSETVTINKALNIYGNESGVLIRANESLPVFNISASGVNISNFTLQDATASYGVYSNASTLAITSVNSKNNSYGFYFTGSTGVVLTSVNASNNSVAQYFFTNSNATFNSTNYAQALPSGSTVLNSSTNSNVTALSGTTYNLMVTPEVSFSFDQARNLTFTVSNTTAQGISQTDCFDLGQACQAVSNLLLVTDVGGASLQQLLVQYTPSLLATGMLESNIDLARFVSGSGWQAFDSSTLADSDNTIRFGAISTFGTFAAVGFSSLTSSTADTETTSDSSLVLTHDDLVCPEGELVVSATSSGDGVSGVDLRLLYNGVTSQEMTTDSDGEVVFTVTQSGSYKVVNSDKKSGYVKATSISFSLTSCAVEETPEVAVEEPVVAPEEPAAESEAPAAEQPAAEEPSAGETPEAPAVTPEEPAAEPEAPAATPEEPAAPTQPTTPPKVSAPDLTPVLGVVAAVVVIGALVYYFLVAKK